MDAFKTFLGVAKEPKYRAPDGSTKEQADEAVRQKTKELAEAIKMSANVNAKKVIGDTQETTEEAWEKAKQLIDNAMHFTGEKVAEGAHVAKEYAADGAATAYEYLQQGGAVAAENIKAGAAYTGEHAKDAAYAAAQLAAEKSRDGASYIAENVKEGSEAALERAAQLAKQLKEASAHQLDNAKEAGANAGERTAEFAGQVKDSLAENAATAGNAAAQKGREFVDAASETLNARTQDAKDLFEQAYASAAEKARAGAENLKDTASDYSDKAGDAYENTKASAKNAANEYSNKASNAYENAKAAAKNTADDVSNKASNAYDNSKETIKDNAAHYSGKASDAYENAKAAAEDNANSWRKVFSSSEWRSFNEQHPDFDYKKYIGSLENVSPSTWKEYAEAHMSGPSGLQKYWNKVDSRTERLKHKISGFNRNVHEHFGARQTLSGGDVVAPVSLFWASLLALYLLVLAKRAFDLRRRDGVYMGEGAISTSDLSSNEKRDFNNARSLIQTPYSLANSSVQAFTTYVPLTVVALTIMETSGLLTKITLHTLYVTVTAGQLLQSGNARTEDGAAPGLYLSWLAIAMTSAFGLYSAVSGGAL